MPIGTNLVLAWPTYATGFALQSASNLQSPTFWWDATNVVGQDDGMNWATNATEAGGRYYRLQHP